MTLATFSPPIAPSTMKGKPELKLLKAEFGDGYTQTARDGLNHIRKVIHLEWEVLTPAQASAIVGFLEQHGGDLPFIYHSATEPLPLKWTCSEWEEGIARGGVRTITATFRQSFNHG